MVVNKYLRRVATELTIELAREEQNVIIFRNEIGLTDELVQLLRTFIGKNDKSDYQSPSAFSDGDVIKTSDTPKFIEADFGESLSGIYLIYLATKDADVQVRSNAVIAFLELSIDGHTMDEIILKRAIQPVVDVAQSSFANNILKRRCAWALSSIGLRYAGMSDDVLGDKNFISSSLGVLGRFLLAENDYVTQREAAKGIAAFSLIEEAVVLIIERGDIIPNMIALLNRSLENVEMYTEILFMALRSLTNLTMYRNGREVLSEHVSKLGYSTLEAYFGRFIEDHWDVSKDIALNITRKLEIAKRKLEEQNKQKPNFLPHDVEATQKEQAKKQARIKELGDLLQDMGSDEILKETREWHVKHRERGLLIPEEIQSECILAIGCLMRSDQLATYKGKWVEYFVHSCKSTDPHISSKALAALANVASFGLAQLRLIEHSRDYCERSIVISRRKFNVALTFSLR